MFKIVNGERLISIGEASKRIGRTPQTVKRWYEWLAQQDEDVQAQYRLPPIFDWIDRKSTRYIREADLDMLVEFRDSVRYGTMSDYNRDFWGKRGSETKERMENKVDNNEDLKI